MFGKMDGGKLRALKYRTEILALISLFFLVNLQVSCFSDSQRQAAGSLGRMRAEDYFASTLQIQFAEAIASGDAVRMSRLLQNGADVNVVGNEDMRPLLWALLKRSPKGFGFLLKNGSNPNFYMTDKDDNPHQHKSSMMELLVETDAIEYLKLVLKYGGDPNFIVESHYPDGRLSSRNTIINKAIIKGKLDNVRVLIEAGADINYQDFYFSAQTPMMTAAGIKRFDMVSFFLEHGADVHLKDRWGYDLAWMLKEYRDRGIKKDSEQYRWYLTVVQELRRRGLLY